MLGPVTVAPEPEELLWFWFGELTDGFADEAHRHRWFIGGPDFDQQCRIRFGALAGRAADGELDHWLDEPRARLAFILLTDQIPRNIHRGQAAAFATDAAALSAAASGVAGGADRSLALDERCFFYLPFEHSENLVDQHTCVGLFTDLRDETPEGFRHLTGGYLRHAHQHRDIVKRFGRFPHRNRILDRITTAAEVAFLEDGNDFGQAG
jgi:uncharacterized protein (DUF924 family)